jgi:hypothetical protein
MKRYKITSSQTMLTDTTPVSQEKYRMSMVLNSAPETVICNYCGHEDFFSKYMVKTKKGYSEKRFICPKCSNGMQRKTLLMATPKEWGEWVYWARAWENKAQPKLNFDNIKSTLQKKGWSNSFWTGYFDAKLIDKGEQPVKETIDEQYASYLKHYEDEKSG